MIIIADSGSTKTDWRLIDNKNQIYQYATQGINPYFQDEVEISEIIKSEFLPQLKSHIIPPQSHIYFYGAGCGADAKKEIIQGALNENFPFSIIEVNTDLLAAARALCGSNPGIAAILGTGSNTCYYDGSTIIENRASLGFIMGDEGSGAHIGKTFIQSYLNKEMPADLSSRFFERFKLSTNDILDAVYKKTMPNRFLASFSKFIYQNLKEQFIIDLVANCFEQFFDKHICKYEKHKELKLSCVGSVAFYYSNILRAVAVKKGVNIDIIIETPIAGLTLFHKALSLPHPLIPSPIGEGVWGEVRDANSFENLFKGASPKLFENAHQLRLVDKTKAEKKLWEVLRNRKIENCKFRRQHPIDKFIADFYCYEKKLIIEVDGGYHDEKEQKERDEARTQVINEYDITVIRFTNEEVLNDIQLVIREIVKALNTSPLNPLSNWRGGRG